MEKKLKLYREKEGLVDAILTIEENNLLYVQLKYEKFDSGRIFAEKLYDCMQSLHRMLDSRNCKLLVNAFRFDIHPSRMALDMGVGIKAYKLVKGKPATELVNIFDPTEEIEAIVSFERQKEFYREWVNSLSD